MFEDAKDQDPFIFCALNSEDSKIVEWLLQQDPSLCNAAARDYQFVTAIRDASTIKLVLKLNPDLLHQINKKGKLPITYWLRRYGLADGLDYSSATDLIKKSLQGKQNILHHAFQVFRALRHVNDGEIAKLIKWLIDCYPVLLQYQNSDEECLLHLATNKIDVFKYIAQKAPSLLYKQDCNGQLAINDLYRCHTDYVWSLLKENPLLITVKDQSGAWAMHRAVTTNNLPFVQWIMGQVEKTNGGHYQLKGQQEKSKSSEFPKDRHPFIFNALYEGDPTIAEWLLQQDPSLCNAFIKDRFLTQFVTSICNASTIKLVLKLNPDLLHRINEEGKLPITYWLYRYGIPGCLDHSSATDLIEKSLQGKQNILGHVYDIFYAIQNAGTTQNVDTNAHTELLKWVIDRYPELLQYQSFDEECLLHLTRINIDVFKYIAQKAPSLLSKQNSRGALAINDWYYSESEYVWSILRQNPLLITVKDQSGAWAMHHAATTSNLPFAQWIMDQVEKTDDGHYRLKEKSTYCRS